LSNIKNKENEFDLIENKYLNVKESVADPGGVRWVRPHPPSKLKYLVFKCPLYSLKVKKKNNT
jgi:hypothetical protein